MSHSSMWMPFSMNIFASFLVAVMRTSRLAWSHALKRARVRHAPRDASPSQSQTRVKYCGVVLPDGGRGGGDGGRAGWRGVGWEVGNLFTVAYALEQQSLPDLRRLPNPPSGLMLRRLVALCKDVLWFLVALADLTWDRRESPRLLQRAWA